MSGSAKVSSGTAEGPRNPNCPEIPSTFTLAIAGGCLDGTEIVLSFDPETAQWEGAGPGACGGWVTVSADCVDDGLGGIGLSYQVTLWESESSPGVENGCWQLSGNMAIESTEPFEAAEHSVEYVVGSLSGCQPGGCLCDGLDTATVSATE